MSTRWKFWSKFFIGGQQNPMMKRLRVIQTPWFGFYIHFIYREDRDRDFHDHPWNFWRMVVKGGYTEEYTNDPKHGELQPGAILPFRPSYFPTKHGHRITTVKKGTVSLVLVGRKSRGWGFWQPVPRRRMYDGSVVRRWIPFEQYEYATGKEAW